MESQRNILLIGLLFVSVLLWQQWQSDKAPQQPQTNVATQPVQHGADVPAADTSVPATVTSSKDLITVKTDQLDVKINPVGGDIVYAALLSHKLELGKNEPFVLMEQTPDFTYIAQSGLIGTGGIDSVKGRAHFTAAKTDYVMTGDTLEVPLTLTADNGVTYTKIFTFHKGKFDVGVDYRIHNTSAEPLAVQMYGQIKQTIKPSESHMMMPTYRGTAFSTQEVRYEKYKFEELAKANLDEKTQGGWVAMLQHYFVSAWVPQANEQNVLYTSEKSGVANIGFRTQIYNVAPGATDNISAQFYVGPKDQAALSALSPTLNLVVDYGFLWWLAVPIYKLLMFFHSIVGNWGCRHYSDHSDRTWSVVSTNQSPVHLHGEDAQPATQTAGAQRPLW